LLTPWDVVTGKLLSVLAFGAVLLGTTVPVAAWCLLLGGVSPTEVLHVYVLLLVTAWWVSALGVLMSTHFTRAVGAIVASYGVILGVAVVSALIAYAGLIWLQIAGHGHTSSMGVFPAALAVGVAVAATSALLAAFINWVMGRIPPLRPVARSGLLTAGMVIVLIGVLMAVAMPLVEKLSNAGPTALLLVNPYVGAAATLEDTAAREMISSNTPPGSGSPAPDLTRYVWSILTWLYIVAALMLWMAAVHHYARRTKS